MTALADPLDQRPATGRGVKTLPRGASHVVALGDARKDLRRCSLRRRRRTFWHNRSRCRCCTVCRRGYEGLRFGGGPTCRPPGDRASKPNRAPVAAPEASTPRSERPHRRHDRRDRRSGGEGLGSPHRTVRSRSRDHPPRSNELRYGAGDYLLVALDMPVVSRVVEARTAKPELGLSLSRRPR